MSSETLIASTGSQAQEAEEAEKVGAEVMDVIHALAK